MCLNAPRLDTARLPGFESYRDPGIEFVGSNASAISVRLAGGGAAVTVDTAPAKAAFVGR
jgi:hypothetical protein